MDNKLKNTSLEINKKEELSPPWVVFWGIVVLILYAILFANDNFPKTSFQNIDIKTYKTATIKTNLQTSTINLDHLNYLGFQRLALTDENGDVHFFTIQEVELKR